MSTNQFAALASQWRRRNGSRNVGASSLDGLVGAVNNSRELKGNMAKPPGTDYRVATIGGVQPPGKVIVVPVVVMQLQP